MSSPAYSNPPSETTISQTLTGLALDLFWSFNHSADQLWEQLDPELWDLTHNPWVVLQTVSRERLLTDLDGKRRAAQRSESWFQKAHPHAALSSVAYFSMEFMLSEALPIYS